MTVSQTTISIPDLGTSDAVEVIEILVKEMSNGEGDMAVIVAGYPKEMKHFLDFNPIYNRFWELKK